MTEFKVYCKKDIAMSLNESEIANFQRDAVYCVVKNQKGYYISTKELQAKGEDSFYAVDIEKLKEHFIPYENYGKPHFARLENTDHTKLVDGVNKLIQLDELKVVQFFEPSEHIIDLLYSSKFGSWENY